MAPDRLRLTGIIRLLRTIGNANPDVVQTWMYHANLLAGFSARLLHTVPLVWGIHNSNLEPRYTSFSARLASALCASFSGFLPTTIAYCGARAARLHQSKGYSKSRCTIIENGVDLERFQRDDSARLRLREHWQISSSDFLIGCVARWHPVKDHPNLLKALSLLAQDDISFRCVLVGSEIGCSNDELAHLIRKFNLEDRIILAGSRDDIPAVMSALDLHVLSSMDEAFPNVVGEAMACGTPCVVTEVGDARLIVGNTGWIAPPNNPQGLHECIGSAIKALSSQDRRKLSERARQRVAEHFSLDKMVNEYVRLWETVSRPSRR
jgi:glycosyltransferase involved in cell wall biosynthesis